jgi:quercetin dioxygenase-like cupin family protein
MFVLASASPVQGVAPGVTRQVLGHDPHMMLVRVTFTKGAIGYIHSHAHRQVTYVESGQFDATLGDERRTIGPGDTYVAPPDLPHGVVALSDGVLIDVFTPAREDFLS